MDNQIIFGVTDEQSGYKDEILLTNMSNRHGCITGATGTGKTVSFAKIGPKSFSKKGVPVFLADIKGDLSGIAKAAVPTDQLKARLEKHRLPTSGLVSLPGCVTGMSSVRKVFPFVQRSVIWDRCFLSRLPFN